MIYPNWTDDKYFLYHADDIIAEMKKTKCIRTGRSYNKKDLMIFTVLEDGVIWWFKREQFSEPRLI